MLENVIKSFIIINVFLMLCITIFGIMWLLEFYGTPSSKSITIYSARALIIVMIMANISYWKAINYFRIHPEKSERISKITTIVSLISAPIFFVFPSKVFCYILLLIISLLYTITVSKEFILFAILPLVDINYMSILIVLYTLYFLKDLFLFDNINRKLLYIDLVIIILAFLGSFFELREIFILMIVISAIILFRRILEFVFKRYLRTRLFLFSLVSLLLAIMPTSKEIISEKYSAMFHALTTCSYSLSFVSLMIMLGRKGLLIFPKGYKNYIKFLIVGIVLMFLHAFSFILDQLYFYSFLALGVYGIIFTIVSMLYFERYIRKSI